MHRRNLLEQTKKCIHMSIDRPVLEEYNKIQLNKVRNSIRINRKKVYGLRAAVKTQQNQSPPKWEQHVDRYMQSKKKIQDQRLCNVNFEFKDLGKNYRSRIIKLANDEALPKEVVSLSMKNSVIESMDKKYNKLQRLPDKKEHRLQGRANIAHRSSFDEPKQTTIQEGRSMEMTKSADIKDKIMNHFVYSYFRSKYRHKMRIRTEEQQFLQRTNTT